jgi:hypothetical protein
VYYDMGGGAMTRDQVVGTGMRGGAPGGGGGGGANYNPIFSPVQYATSPGGGGGGGYIGGDGGANKISTPGVGGTGGWCQGSAEGSHQGSGPTSLPPQVVITYTWQEILQP